MDQRLPFPCSARVQRDIQPRNHVGFITAGCRCPRVLSLWLAGRGNEACAAGGARPLVEGGCCRFGGRFASRRKDVVFVSRQETPPPPGKGRLDPSGRSAARGSPASGGTRVIRPLRAGARVGTHGGLRRRGGERGRRAPRVPVPRTHRPRGVWDGSASSACRRVSVPCPVRAPEEAAANPDTWEEWGARTGLSLGCSCARPSPSRSPGPPHAAVSEPSAVFHAKLQLSPTGKVKFRSITCLC